MVEYAKKVVAEQQPEGRLSWSAVVTGPFYDWVSIRKRTDDDDGGKEKGERLMGETSALSLGTSVSISTIRRLHCMMREKGSSPRYVEKPSEVISPWGKCFFSKKRNTHKEHPTSRLTYTNQTTLSKIGASVAALLTRPTKYANSYIFISSFTTSQAAMFAAVKAASGTKDTDWTIENKSTEAYMQEGREKVAQGNIYGTYDLIFGSVFGGSKYGSDYGTRREISNEELGLEEEDLESVTREVLEGQRPQVEW